jgi:hypothetical protein
MKQTDPQLKFRVTAELKAKLQAAADGAFRPLNSEIVERLEASLREPATVNAAELEAWKRSIEWRLAKIESRLQNEETPAEPAATSLDVLHGARKLIE